MPVGKKRQQKVALGDANGVVQCMAVKKGQTEAVFKTLPTRQPVSAVVLGASTGQADRIFSASGQTIRGHSKTGKEFFKFVTNLAEDIKHLHIEGTEIWTTGRTTCNLLGELQGLRLIRFALPDLGVGGRSGSLSGEGPQPCPRL